uniref:Uncharacterized protein n=1 Tax=Romanomermis culicivorax TaxID=13658 RepID=A0A915JS79_ROMCU
MGMDAFRGGTMIRTPEWRQPRMAPPRASTMNEMRKLKNSQSKQKIKTENAMVKELIFSESDRIANNQE